MSKGEELPLDLTWQPDGHATEIALSMIADGEHAQLPEGVESHVDECEACSMRLGAAALLSLRATEELPAVAARLALDEARTEVARISGLRAPQGSPVAVPVAVMNTAPIARPLARPVPVRAIAAALLVAVVGAIPSLVMGLPKLPDLMRSIIKMLPIVGRAVIALFQGTASGPAWMMPTLPWLAALLFLFAGISLARSMSRTRSIQGGVG